MHENAQSGHAPGQVRQKEGTHGESSRQPPLSFPLTVDPDALFFPPHYRASCAGLRRGGAVVVGTEDYHLGSGSGWASAHAKPMGNMHLVGPSLSQPTR